MTNESGRRGWTEEGERGSEGGVKEEGVGNEERDRQGCYYTSHQAELLANKILINFDHNNKDKIIFMSVWTRNSYVVPCWETLPHCLANSNRETLLTVVIQRGSACSDGRELCRSCCCCCCLPFSSFIYGCVVHIIISLCLGLYVCPLLI